jgi:hypothetical protein
VEIAKMVGKCNLELVKIGWKKEKRRKGEREKKRKKWKFLLSLFQFFHQVL